MNLIVVKDYEAMSLKAADIFSALLTLKRDCVLGLATGSTPVGMYKELQRRNRNGEISFKDVKTVNLDEYYPISPDNEQSYRHFMNENLFNHVDIDLTNTPVLNGLAEDPDKECAEYDALIDSLGGIDLQVLGIGRNGHIGFNEPDEFLVPVTHKTKLTESTIEANSRFFASLDEVPRYSLTMGMGSILKARKIIILVSGKEKKEAARRMMEGVLDTRCPASFLSLHSDVTVIATEDAV